MCTSYIIIKYFYRIFRSEDLLQINDASFYNTDSYIVSVFFVYLLLVKYVQLYISLQYAIVA